jgi:hypothetical protein
MWESGFRVWYLGLEVWGQNSELRVIQNFGFRVQGPGFRV